MIKIKFKRKKEIIYIEVKKNVYECILILIFGFIFIIGLK